MKEFNSIDEMMPYYDEEKDLFYIEDDIKLNFDLDGAWWDITARNINAMNIDALDINAMNINAVDITARNINACDINARNINAYDINAWEINAKDISYYAVCFAYKNILCDSIEGTRENARHFVLDGELIVKGE